MEVRIGEKNRTEKSEGLYRLLQFVSLSESCSSFDSGCFEIHEGVTSLCSTFSVTVYITNDPIFEELL